MPGLQRLALLAPALVATLGCANLEKDSSHGCPNISGVYANRTSGGESLISYLLGAASQPPPGGRVVLTVNAEGDVDVSHDGRHVRTLKRGVDHDCARGELALRRVDSSTITLPPVVIETIDTHYAFVMADEKLRLKVWSRTRARTFGIPLRRPRQHEQIIEWQRPSATPR